MWQYNIGCITLFNSDNDEETDEYTYNLSEGHYFRYKYMRSTDYVFNRYGILCSRYKLREYMNNNLTVIGWMYVYLCSLIQVILDLSVTFITGILTPIFIVIYVTLLIVAILIHLFNCLLWCFGLCMPYCNNICVKRIEMASEMREMFGYLILDLILSYFFAPLYLIISLLQIFLPYLVISIMEFDTWYPIKQNVGFYISQNRINYSPV